MIKRIFKILLRTTLWFVVLSTLWVLIYRWVPVQYTPLMGIRAMTSDENYERKHQWIDLNTVSPQFQLAVICAEDQKFPYHNGFDMKAIKKAYKDNRNGNRLKGGSTISQQTAKNVFLWPHRDWVRKGLEAWFTFLIENLWSKERILEVYVNSVEMGDGVYGAQAAAKYWFNKNASELTTHEAAAIAAILPNPREYSANPRSVYVEGRKQWILTQMYNFGELRLTTSDQLK